MMVFIFWEERGKRVPSEFDRVYTTAGSSSAVTAPPKLCCRSLYTPPPPPPHRSGSGFSPSPLPHGRRVNGTPLKRAGLTPPTLKLFRSLYRAPVLQRIHRRRNTTSHARRRPRPPRLSSFYYIRVWIINIIHVLIHIL